MNLNEKSILRLNDALPIGFDFYNLGHVSAEPALDFEESNPQSVSFRIFGDFDAYVVILFSGEADLSTYCELGNIIASRVVSQLHSEKNVEIMLSSPRVLSSKQLEVFLRMNPPAVTKTYSHSNANTVIPVRVVISPVNQKEVGNA